MEMLYRDPMCTEVTFDTGDKSFLVSFVCRDIQLS